MNKQEHQKLFDTIATNLIKQGRPAQSPHGDCRYRLEDGDQVLKCAVGWLIPDELYDPGMDCTGDISALLERYRLSLNPILGAYPWDILKLYQSVHDRCDYFGTYFYIPGMQPKEGQSLHPGRPSHWANWLRAWAHDMRAIANHYGLDASALDSVPKE